MLFGELNALICKSTGLELNPALRVSSISHRTTCYVGSRKRRRKHGGRPRVRKLAEVVKIATICLFYICMNNILCGHGSDCLTSHV